MQGFLSPLSSYNIIAKCKRFKFYEDQKFSANHGIANIGR